MQPPASMEVMWSPAIYRIRDILMETCCQAHIGVKVKVGKKTLVETTARPVQLTSYFPTQLPNPTGSWAEQQH